MSFNRLLPMTYIPVSVDGHQTTIVRDDYSLRSYIAAGWSVVGVLDDGDGEQEKTRLVIARTLDAAHQERERLATELLEKLRNAENEARETRTELEAARERNRAMRQKLEEIQTKDAADRLAQVHPRFDTEV